MLLPAYEEFQGTTVGCSLSLLKCHPNSGLHHKIFSVTKKFWIYVYNLFCYVSKKLIMGGNYKLKNLYASPLFNIVKHKKLISVAPVVGQQSNTEIHRPLFSVTHCCFTIHVQLMLVFQRTIKLKYYNKQHVNYK